jgi:L,D-transpeptidase catalytic domain
MPLDLRQSFVINRCMRHCRAILILLMLAVLFSGCATRDSDHRILISVADQSMELYHKTRLIGRFLISTSKFGLGDRPGSRATPLGRMEVAKKIGAGAPLGAVFRSRRQTGEILRPDAPGRDPIVTRIIWLKGLESQNRHAFGRCIYIHGTPEERYLGHPASFGCIRMRSSDVRTVFDIIGLGASVDVIPGRLPDTPRQEALASTVPHAAPAVSPPSPGTPIAAASPAPAPGTGSALAIQTAAVSTR